MKIIQHAGAVALFAFASLQPVSGAQTRITDTDREAVVLAVSQIIEDEFFDRDRAAAIAAGLRSAEMAGEFDAAGSAEALAGALTTRLQGLDRHFRVNYDGPARIAEARAREAAEENGAAPTADPGLSRRNFGFNRVEILPGNIGYIDLREFAPIGPAETTARAALEFIAHTDAVIFDVRANGGGDPSMVQYLISHFLQPGGETLINTFVSRDYEYPNQLWSLPSHPAGNRPDTPVFVLTSGRTGSAAEAFPYHLRALERAVLVGETTFGAGNPGGMFLIDEGYSIFVSTASARNPITGGNWEGTGVAPHIAAPAGEALDRALIEAYGALAQATAQPDRQLELSWLVEALEVSRAPVVLSEAALARYAGDFGVREIWVENGDLTYRRDGREPITLIALGEDRFMFDDDPNYRLVFRFDRQNAVEAMDMLTWDGRVMVNPLEN